MVVGVLFEAAFFGAAVVAGAFAAVAAGAGLGAGAAEAGVEAGWAAVLPGNAANTWQV